MSERHCGECTVCCEVAEVQDLKPAWTPCPHQRSSPQGSCAIYGLAERPHVCLTFQCQWRRGFGLEDWRPDRVGVMLSVNDLPDGRFGLAMETRPGAVLDAAHVLVQFARLIMLPILVVGPGGVDADRMVVHDELAPRTSGLIRQPLARLSWDVGLYQREGVHQ